MEAAKGVVSVGDGVLGRGCKAGAMHTQGVAVRKMEVPKFHGNRIHLYNGVGQARK